MIQSSPPRFRRRSLALALALGGLVVAVLGFRHRAMRQNQTSFRAQYDSTTYDSTTYDSTTYDSTTYDSATSQIR